MGPGPRARRKAGRVRDTSRPCGGRGAPCYDWGSPPAGAGVALGVAVAPGVTMTPGRTAVSEEDPVSRPARPVGRQMIGAPAALALAALVAASLLISAPAPAADTAPPGAVTDLAFASSEAPELTFDPETGVLSGAPLVFTWTAPGDDGGEGQAWRYDVRFIRGGLDEESWERAQPMADPIDLPLPSPAGDLEVLAFTEFSGLAAGAHYEMGLKALDETGRPGPLSNVLAIDAPGETETWAETVDVDGMEVWAWGAKLAGSQVECRYENSALILDGHARPYLPEEEPVALNFAAYGSVPMVRSLVGEGVAFEEAVYRYLRVRRAFLSEMSAIGRNEGPEAVVARLETSALVDSVVKVAGLGGYVLLKGEHQRADFLWADDEPGIPAFHYFAESTRPGQALAALDWLKTQAEDPGDPPGIIVFARGGMMHLTSRRDLRAFQEQVEHIERGGRLARLPPGPLSKGPAREFLLAAKYYRE